MQSKFISWDINMYDKGSDTTASVINGNMNADLGQIEYLFCDKNGTLTENKM